MSLQIGKEVQKVLQVRVGFGILIWKRGKILLHRRLGKHQHGMWAPPGGHIEYGESFEECLLREILEECGPDLKIGDMRLFKLTNCVYSSEGLHYVVPIFTADWISGEARVMEPDKCEGWGWYDWGNLPQPLMSGIQQCL